ncbi:MAG: hypothetical protein AUJ60_08480 [Nitrospirae bacterium CG1_02_44_142]|nr:MAG: hypothetical protein AUJ60_08480 [Nitrospirae bacterium CG1_02_44_142]
MSWKLEKLSGDDNLTAVFCLTVPSDELTVTFTRQTFRKVFEGELGFTPQRTGHVLRLLNQLFPIPRKPIKFENRYSDFELKEYLESLGFFVARKISNRVDPYTAITLLEQKGYQIFGYLGDSCYRSPELNFSKN